MSRLPLRTVKTYFVQRGRRRRYLVAESLEDAARLKRAKGLRGRLRLFREITVVSRERMLAALVRKSWIMGL